MSEPKEIEIKTEVTLEYNCLGCDAKFEYETDWRRHMESHKK